MIVSHRKFDLWEKPLIEKINIKPPYRFSANFSQQACYIYYEKGTTLINSPAEQVLIKSDESVILNCGNYFADLLEYPDGDYYEILVFHLQPDTLKRLYRLEFPEFLKKGDDGRYIHKVTSSQIIRKFIENLYFYFENPALVTDEILELKVKELILILLQSKNAHSIRDLLLGLFTPVEANLKQVVWRHLFSNLSVKDLAELSNLTLATFNRKFQEFFNDSPANFIKIKRLERAKELLLISNLTISEIAFQTCFKDVPHFSRSFKKLFHTTPASFRISGKRPSSHE